MRPTKVHEFFHSICFWLYEQKSGWHSMHQPHRVSQELNIAPNSV